VAKIQLLQDVKQLLNPLPFRNKPPASLTTGDHNTSFLGQLSDSDVDQPTHGLDPLLATTGSKSLTVNQPTRNLDLHGLTSVCHTFATFL
jgi:hypothetical protein